MAAADPIIHWGIALNAYAIKSAAVPSLDSKGYDTASMDILWRGTIANLLAAFPRGAENMPGVPGGARMFCQGVIGAPESKYGGVWAKIGWIGFFDPPALTNIGLVPGGGGAFGSVSGLSLQLTSQEIELPQTINDIEVVLGAPMLPAGQDETNPDSGTYWRARVIDEAHVRQYQGYTISTPSTPPAPPACTATDPDTTDPINWSSNTGPANAGQRVIRRVNYWAGKSGPGGWVRRDFSPVLDHALGNVALWSWNATFEWMQEYSS